MADVLLKQTRYEDAAREYRARIRLVPNDPVAHQSLGVGAHRTGSDSGGSQGVRQAVELAPNDPLNRLDLGNALADVGRLADAVRAYHDGLRVGSLDVPIRQWLLAAVLAAQGDNEAAVNQFRRSLELDPRNQENAARLRGAPGIVSSGQRGEPLDDGPPGLVAVLAESVLGAGNPVVSAKRTRRKNGRPLDSAR